MYSRLFHIALLLLFWVKCEAQTLRLDSEFRSKKITTESYYYEDCLHSQDIHRALNVEESAWQQVPKNGLAKPQNPYAYWIRFEVDVLEGGDYYLTNEFTLLDTLSLFVIDDSGGIEKVEDLGDKGDINGRNIQFRVPSFKTSLEANSTYQFYLFGYKNQSTCMMPIYLWSEDSFIGRVASSENLNGIIYGILISFLLISFLTGIYFKQRVYFFYSIHVLGLILFLLSTLGTGLIYVWNDFPEFNTISGYMSVLLTMTAFSLVIVDSLEVKQYHPRFYKIIQWIIAGYIFLTFGVYFLYNYFPQSDLMPLIRLGHFSIGMFPLIVLFICIQIYRQRRTKIALYLILVFQITIISYLILPLTPLGIVPYEIYSYFKWLYPLEGFFLLIVLINDLYQSKLKTIELQTKLLEEEEVSKSNYLQGELQERKRLAQQLHDSLSLRLASFKMNLSRKLDDEQMDVLHDIDRISKNVRPISHALSPITLERKGLIAALEEEIFHIESGNPDLVIEFDYPVDFKQPEKVKSQVFYYSILELLQNIQKHSKASHIRIVLKEEDNKLSAIIIDDGVQYKPDEENQNGIGLHNIQSRIQMIGGEFSILTNINKGMSHKITA